MRSSPTRSNSKSFASGPSVARPRSQEVTTALSDTEDAGEGQEQDLEQAYQVVEMMLADAYSRGEEVQYYNLRLVRYQSYRNLWRIFNDDGELIDTANLVAFRSVEELAEWLNDYVRVEAESDD